MKTLLTQSLTVLLMLISVASAAQSTEILALTGATTLEELDSSEAERLASFSSHPIDINTASRSRLTASGLFTPLQVAAICESRAADGAIRSLTELGTLDGFTPQGVQMLAPFITLQSATGRTPDNIRHSVELQGRCSTRMTEGEDQLWSYRSKARYEMEDRLSLAGAWKHAYPGTRPLDSWGASAVLYGQRHLGKIIVGDFNARFGQGLGLWSGWSLGGAGSAESFSKRPSGISQAWSYSQEGSLRGLAADFSLGRWTLSAMTAIPGLRERMDGDRNAHGDILPALNLAWLGRRSQASATALWSLSGESRISADIRWTPGRAMLFGEAAYDISHRAPAVVGGMMWTPSYGRRLSVVARCYPSAYGGAWTGAMRAGSKVSDETGLALGATLPWLRLSADACWQPQRDVRQLKLVASTPLTYRQFALTPRISARLRPGQTRLEARLDGEWTSGPWLAHARADLVRCMQASWLGYAECGYRQPRIWAYLRTGVFKVDNWDDRIYVYERDAPGNFSVPAYYGRGYAGSLTAGIKLRRSHIYLRASHIRYVSDKPSRSEAALQYVLKI